MFQEGAGAVEDDKPTLVPPTKLTDYDFASAPYERFASMGLSWTFNVGTGHVRWDPSRNQFQVSVGKSRKAFGKIRDEARWSEAKGEAAAWIDEISKNPAT